MSKTRVFTEAEMADWWCQCSETKKTNQCDGCGDFVCDGRFHKNHGEPINIQNRCRPCYYWIMGQRESKNYNRRPL